MRKATPVPARKPSTGASARPENICANAGDSPSGLTAAVMFRRPVKRMPKPIVMLPTVSLCGVLMAMMKRMPAMAAKGASVEGLNRLSHAPPSALRSSSRMI